MNKRASGGTQLGGFERSTVSAEDDDLIIIPKNNKRLKKN